MLFDRFNHMVSLPLWLLRRVTATYRARYLLQLCSVDGRRTLIYAAALKQQSPVGLFGLTLCARSLGYRMLQDRRQRSTSVSVERRDTRRMVLTSLQLMVVALMLRSLPAWAEAPHFYASSLQDATMVRPLRLFASQSVSHYRAYPHTVIKPAIGYPGEVYRRGDGSDDERVRHAGTILRKHFKSRSDTPEFVQRDVEQMAVYIAAQPEAYALLASLEDKRWSLRYAPQEFRTDVRGNAFSVRSVRVYFDSRSAARLKNGVACEETLGQCIASPVDALLHELLHAQYALLKTKEFLTQGGMNSALYPVAHERSVIALESALYSHMTASDQHARPHRRTHSGQLVAAACVTCLEG